jgi:hypothetical protein
MVGRTNAGSDIPALIDSRVVVVDGAEAVLDLIVRGEDGPASSLCPASADQVEWLAVRLAERTDNRKRSGRRT